MRLRRDGHLGSRKDVLALDTYEGTITDVHGTALVVCADDEDGVRLVGIESVKV